MSSIIEEFENFVIHDDIDFEITKYVDNFMEYDKCIQKDILHQIVKHTIEYRDKKDKLESQLESQLEKYNTVYETNILLIKQLHCAERVNDTLSSFTLSFINKKQEKRDFIKKIMKYGFMFGSVAGVAGYYYISRKS